MGRKYDNMRTIMHYVLFSTAKYDIMLSYLGIEVVLRIGNAHQDDTFDEVEEIVL